MFVCSTLEITGMLDLGECLSVQTQTPSNDGHFMFVGIGVRKSKILAVPAQNTSVLGRSFKSVQKGLGGNLVMKGGGFMKLR